MTTIEDLAKLLEVLANIAGRTRKNERKRRTIADKVYLLQAQLVLKVSKEKDERGKLLYSNEKLRAAAVTVAESEHDEYRKLRAQLAECDAAGDELYLQQNRLIDQKALAMFTLGVPPDAVE